MEKTIYIQSEQKVSLCNNNINICDREKNIIISLSNIDNIIFENTRITVSLKLLNHLVNNGIRVIICDDNKYPNMFFAPFVGTKSLSQNVCKQFEWVQNQKDDVWKQIVEVKMEQQRKVLEFCNISCRYRYTVLPGDTTNAEGQFARIYFSKLFGRNFQRHAEDEINRALNYGYAILVARICQEICLNGYLTQIGIHHHSKTNNYNLAYDIIEPFRPAVDRIVFLNKNNKFDSIYKQNLIAVLNEPMLYDGKKYNLGYAIKLFVKDLFKTMETSKNHIKELLLI